MSVIKTVGLTKNYGDFCAVNDLNITVEHGKVYGFVGKNGAGKTTTINMILSLLKSSEGEIYIDDELIGFNDIDYKKKIGFVSDVPVFPSYMDAVEYLTFVADVFEMEKNIIKPRIKEVLNFVGLDLSKKLVKGYSRGMKQRLAIAAGLINSPDILIMDEPTSALDPVGRKQVLDIIGKLKGEKTVFYSTHILSDVERVCDVVCLIDEGKLLIEDTISNIKSKYYLKRFSLDTTNNELALKLLKEVNWIKEVDKYNNKITIEYNDEIKSKHKLMKLMLENDLDIIEISRVEMNLEDIFMKVVNHENIT